jgi:hypothetical protein
MKKLITIFFLIANVAQAQFNGFPFAQNYTNADANWIGTNFHPIQQLYSGVVERVNLINNGGSTIAPLELVNTYVCSAGTGFSYTVDGSNTYTNILLFTTNVTVTNTFVPFSYSYSDTSGVHSATAMPFVTRGMISDIDSKIDELIPYFVSASTLDGGYYVATRTNWVLDPAVQRTVPTESKAGLFTRAGIGYATNLTTNTNDVYAVVYTNNHPTYGSASDKYFLTASDYDERYRVLTNLTRTMAGSLQANNHPGVYNSVTGRTYNGTTPFQSNDWAGLLVTVSNALANGSNWTSNYVNAQGVVTYITYSEPGLPGDTNYYIGIGDHINDDMYYTITNMPQVNHVASHYILANGSDYYDFRGTFPVPNAIYKKVSSNPETNSVYRNPIQWWENPLYDVPTTAPDWGSVTTRYQQIGYTFWVIDWKSGLKYK